MINYMIALWLVALVLAPLLAMRQPLESTAAIQVYFLGMLGVVLSSIRSEHPEFLSDGIPLIVAFISIGAVFLAHPRRSQLWRIV